MCGKSATTTTQSAPNPAAMQAYQNLLNQAGSVSQLPFQQYGGQFVAPLNAQQQAAGANINANAGFALPFIQQGAQYATEAAQPVTAAQIAGFQSPYTQQVVNATEAQFNNQNQQQLENVRGNAAAQGALGGDREAIAEAITSGQQALGQNQTIAGLYNQGYNTALSTALQEQQQLGQSAYSLGNLGVAGQNAALSGANAQLGYGTLGQSTQQALDQALYNQFLAQQAYPFQTTQWLAGIDTAAGSQMGGTSSTTGPAPNTAAQWGGLGLAALSFLKDGGGIERDRGGRIPGFAFGGMPYDGGSSYIPSINLTMGQGAPKPPGTSSSSQSQIDPFKLASSTMDLEKKISGLGGGSSSSFFPSDTFLSAGDDSGPGFMSFARGGGLHDDDRPSAFRQEIERRRDLSDAYIPHPAKIQDRFISGVRGSSADMPLWDSGFCDGGKVRGFAGGGLADDAGIDDIGASRLPDLEGALGPQPPGDRGLGLGDIVQSAAPGFENNFGFDVASPTRRYNDAMQQSGDRYAASAAGEPPLLPGVVNALRDESGNPQNATGPHIPPGGTGGGSEAASAPAPGLDMAAYAPVPGTAGAPAIPSSTGEAKAEKTAGFGILDRLGIHLDPNTRKAMLAAGFGMMASRSPFLGNAIGEGGLAGLSAYNAGEKQQLSVEESRKKLEQHAKEVADKLALETKKEQHNEEYRQQHLDYLKQHSKELLEQGKFSAPMPGTGQNSAGENVPGAYVTNMRTGEPIFHPNVVLTPKGGAAAGEPSFDKATLTKMADQYLAGDKSVLVNLGRGTQGATDLKALRQRIAERMDEKGVTPEQQAVKMAEYQGMGAGQRALGTRTANIEMAANEARNMMPIALQAADAVPRTSWTPINKLIEGWQTGVVSDPTQAKFAAANFSLVNAYVRAIAPTGVPPESARQHALQMLSGAMSHESYKAVVATMDQEMQAALHSPGQVMDKFRQLYGQGAGGAHPAAAPAAGGAPIGVGPAAGNGFTGRTATNPQTGQRMREIAPNQWAPF